MAEPTSWPRFTTARPPSGGTSYLQTDPIGKIAGGSILTDGCFASRGAQRRGLRQRADQRVGAASAPISSWMAASNWLAEAANVNLSSSRPAETMPTTAGMPLMSTRIGEPE
jgi:hypothetical protein